jgi:3-phosphoshikimate 1-carboxyvinyltransferase
MESLRVSCFERVQGGIHKVALPCSKSLVLRHAVYAAIAEGDSVLRNVSLSDDLEDMLSALRVFGVASELEGDALTIRGCGGSFDRSDVEVNLSLSGVTARMITALAALRPGVTRIDGYPPLRKRPLGGIIDGVRQLGVTVQGEMLPISVEGGCLSVSKKVVLDGSISSQFFTAMLAIGPYIPGGLVIEVRKDLVSKPYIDLTLEAMKKHGLVVVNEDYKLFSVPEGKYCPVTLGVPADVSAASYFMALATLHGMELLLPEVFEGMTQGDLAFLDICRSLGANGEYTEAGLIVRGPTDGTLRALPGAVDMEAMPDVAPTLFALAPFIPGGVKVTGLQTLRVKECDRIASPQEEFRKLGLRFDSGADWVQIGELDVENLKEGVSCGTYHDHRMAMSLAVLGSKLPVSFTIEDPSCVSKTFPLFWGEYFKLGGVR